MKRNLRIEEYDRYSSKKLQTIKLSLGHPIAEGNFVKFMNYSFNS